jgi:hypothetical protein
MAHIDQVINSINNNIKTNEYFAIDSESMHDIIQNWNYRDIISMLQKIEDKDKGIIFGEITDTLINLNKLDIFKIIIKKFSFSFQLPGGDQWQYIILNHINYGHNSFLILLKYMYTIGIMTYVI